MSDRVWLTIPDAARRVGRSRATIYRWAEYNPATGRALLDIRGGRVNEEQLLAVEQHMRSRVGRPRKEGEHMTYEVMTKREAHQRIQALEAENAELRRTVALLSSLGAKSKNVMTSDEARSMLGVPADDSPANAQIVGPPDGKLDA